MFDENGILDEDRLDDLVQENFDNQRKIMELNEKLNLALEVLNFYKSEYDDGFMAKEVLDQIA